MNKVVELCGIVAVSNPSVVMITESWLNTNIPDSAVAIGNNFNLYRRDRPTPGGGVLAYVNVHLPSTQLKNLEEDGKEVLWLKLKPARTPRPFSLIVVVGVYYPPGQSTEAEREMNEYITKGLDSILYDHPSAGVIITGDFNQMNLNQLCRRFNLKKSVKAPTRGNNTLDQILTNMSELYNDVQHLPPVGRSDHQCLLLIPKTRQKIKPSSRRVRLLKPGNLMALGLKLNREEWMSVFCAHDVDDKVSAFTDIIARMLDESVPERTIRVHASDKPWMTSLIKQEIKARQRAFTNGDSIKYKQLCNKVSVLITKAKAEHYRSKAKGLRKHNPAKWYEAIFQLVGVVEGNATNLSSERTANTAELLQEIFTRPWQNISPTVIPGLADVVSLLKEVTPPIPSIGQVKTTLRHLNPRKATGSDKIPAWLLKRFCEELAPVVHDIICSSITQFKYPTLYKHALITPVPKVYPPNDIESDFRQISILPQLAKVLEKLQLKLNSSDLKIDNSQHAFTSKRSTVSALACISQNWFNNTDNARDGRNGVHALFIDFRKAFDLVDHGILLTKLARMNVTKGFWLWTRSFLEGRSQQVNLGGTLSSVKPCPAGVPQGSVISPTLFNVHINDLEDSVPNHLSINTCKYADDCTQDEVVPMGSSSHMQEVLEAVQSWADRNKMILNSNKTKDMWICFRNAIPEPPSLFIGSDVIERVSSFKLLGVWHQRNLKWNCHIEMMTKKANKLLFCLRECRRANLPTEVGITCYQTKIRPVLEYAAPIWSGLPQYLEDEIEKIQTRSLRILGMPCYHLQTLKHRRNHLTIREFQRIQSDITHPCNKLIPTPITHPYDLRTGIGRPSISSRTKRHELSFIPRAISLL